LYVVSPRLARISDKFFTSAGIGTVITKSSSAGELLLLTFPKPELPPRRPPGRTDEPDKVELLPGPVTFVRETRTSKSAQVGPREVLTSTFTGSLRLAELLVNLPEATGRRSTSYPANTKRPSGGIKLSSPGRSLHLANLTHGWKTGRSIKFSVFCLPDGDERVKRRSGTPEIFDVNAIVPFAKAAIGRPDGASMTDKVSTRSTYSSFEVCRTFALRHRRAGEFEAEGPSDDIPGIAVEEFDVLLDVKPGFLQEPVSISPPVRCQPHIKA
jgi:hypothetical protein